MCHSCTRLCCSTAQHKAQLAFPGFCVQLFAHGFVQTLHTKPWRSRSLLFHVGAGDVARLTTQDFLINTLKKTNGLCCSSIQAANTALQETSFAVISSINKAVPHLTTPGLTVTLTVHPCRVNISLLCCAWCCAELLPRHPQTTEVHLPQHAEPQTGQLHCCHMHVKEQAAQLTTPGLMTDTGHSAVHMWAVPFQQHSTQRTWLLQGSVCSQLQNAP
jgi:hypothetical protein